MYQIEDREPKKDESEFSVVNMPALTMETASMQLSFEKSLRELGVCTIGPARTKCEMLRQPTQ